VFVHIPPPEVATIFTPPTQPGSVCTGTLADDGITPTIGENTLVSTLFAANGTNAGVFFGHDHGNAYCCAFSTGNMTSAVNLCYGRHSGFGGYGDWPRGARVIEISMNATFNELSINTWIRMEDGSTNSFEVLRQA
jgi:hypothetical protein